MSRVGKWGELRLTLGVKGGRTVIEDIYCQVPLKVTKPFYLEPETGGVFIYQMNPAGGMVQGDYYYQEVMLGPGARAFLTTQSAAKIYRCPDSSAGQHSLFKLAEGAVLEYFPDPVIPFAGSKFNGQTEIYLASGAVAFLAEVVTPGRVAREELFGFDYYQSRTKAYWNGKIILWDNWRLVPASQDLGAPGMYEGYTHQGNLYIFSEKVTQELAGQLHQQFHQEGTADSHLLAGVSLTARYGIAVRLLGRRAADVEKAIIDGWDLARRALLGRGRPSVRKY